MIDKEQRISQATLDQSFTEIFASLYPETAISIRKGGANGVEFDLLPVD
jgi:DNA-damage-inducible protein I